MIDLLPVSVVLGTSLWVLIDSRNLGIRKGTTKGFFNMGPTGWFLSCLLCWIAAFPAYLVKRREYTRAAAAAAAAAADGQAGSTPVEPASHADFMSQLGALADLSAQDLLTEEEFQAKKKELVHRMLEQSSQDASS